MAKKYISSLATLAETLRQFRDSTSLSLTQATAESLINTRAFIQASVAESEIITPIIKLAMNLETGFVLTALQMHQMVTKSKTVRDIMSAVGTEYMSAKPYLSLTAATESLSGKSEDTKFENPFKMDEALKSTAASKILDPNLANSIPVHGRIIEITFGKPAGAANKDGETTAVTVSMYLNVFPTVISDLVAEAFVTTNIPPSFGQRALQYRAGEISFWKDVILGMDMLKARRKALRSDRSGALRDMYDYQENAVGNAMLKYAQMYPEKQNIASALMIFDKASFSRACHSVGLNFDRFSDRQRFFNKALPLMVFLVDQEYNRATVYFHGLDLKATYNFRDLKENAKNEKYDLVELMQSMNRGTLSSR